MGLRRRSKAAHNLGGLVRSKADTDSALLEDVLTANLEGSRHGAEFFVRKAVGWALREHAKTDAAWVRGYVDAHAAELSGLSRREALKNV